LSMVDIRFYIGELILLLHAVLGDAFFAFRVS